MITTEKCIGILHRIVKNLFVSVIKVMQVLYHNEPGENLPFKFELILYAMLWLLLLRS